MKILILTQYYPPETGAPQNRLSSLAKYLTQMGNEVSVLTAMPNYPKMEVLPAYRGKWFLREVLEGISVTRAWIYVSKNKSIFQRLLNYFSFVFTAMFVGLFRVSRHDVIICESPPLFLGITALILKWFKRSRLVFNISDPWPESAEKLGLVTNRIMLGMAEWLELFIYRHSDLLSGQTQGCVAHMQPRAPGKKIFWLPNGIDIQFFEQKPINLKWREEQGFQPDDLIILYAGILGYAQGLDVIIRAAQLLHEVPRLKFVLVGDGPEKERLQALTAELQLKNVTFIPNQPREVIPSIVSAADLYVVPLKKLDLFLGGIPSKMFEPLYYGKPILLGVDGEARELFINKGKAGLYFEPENYQELANGIRTLSQNPQLCRELGDAGQAYVKEFFNREKIAADYDRFLRENLNLPAHQLPEASSQNPS